MNIEAVARQYTKKEGWLEKKSPSFPFGFQKRFFSICDDTNVLYLLYDKNQPTKDKKPKGAINISLIQEIITKETSREFTFKFSGRDFVLRAPTLQDKVQWIETIKFLKEYAIGSKEASADDTAQVNPSEKVGWKFEKLDPTLQRNLRINIEKKNQGEDLTKEIEIKDEQMQKIKGIFPYFEKYSDEAILNHVVQGFLYKKKERFTNKVVQPKQRWFFMFTDFSLTENARQDLSDFDLDDLPPFVNPNVIYYYSMSLDESPCEGYIPIKTIISIKKLDLKVEGDNILKKGIDGIGNTMITAMNKFTEITMLDKIGAHIHRFEFQFQLVTSKDGKEVTHNFYSASLLQIEKWVKSITKVMELYKAREVEKEAQKLAEQKQQLENSQAAANNINNNTNTNDTTTSNNATTISADGTDKSQQLPLQKQITNQSQVPANSNFDSDDEHPVSGSPQKPGIQDSSNSNPSSTTPQPLQSSPQQAPPQAKRRDQIILQTSLKTKAWSKIRNAWSDRFTVLRRQILSVYHDEKELANLEAESYITLKDISSVLAETNKFKLKIIKKNKEEKRFKFKDQQTRDQWYNALIMLTADEDAPIERLQALPSNNASNPNTTGTTSAKEIKSTGFVQIDDDKRGPSINGETYQPQGTSSSKSSFSSVDNLMFKAYSSSYNSQESTEAAMKKKSDASKKKSCFGSLFSCCIPSKNNQTTPEEGDEEAEQFQDSKTKKLLS